MRKRYIRKNSINFTIKGVLWESRIIKGGINMVKRVLLKSGLVAAALGIMLTSGLTVEAAQMRSAKEIVHQMGIGWNLGNTLDSFVGDGLI